MNRRKFFDVNADRWDGMMPRGLVSRVEKKIAPLFGVKKSERVLDVGSGTGILLPFLRKAAGPGGKIVALDYSSRMLEKAREKFGDGFTYVCANAERMPFRNGSFNRVICFSAFPHFPRKLKVMRELKRVLKAGGKLIVAHADTRETLNKRHTQIGGAVRRDLIPEDSRMIKLLARAGFEDAFVREGKNFYIAGGVKPFRRGSAKI